MMLKLIACNVFLREACHCVARAPHIFDIEFTELGDHIHSDSLRTQLQARIDAASKARPYDAILLLFGICGNSTVGLEARTIPLILPRAHDCCTLLLGSRERFKEHFQDAPSTPFSSAGYMERGEYYLRTNEGDQQVHYGDAYAEYVRQYGEENAKYIWESMHPPLPEGMEEKAVFIDLPETAALGYAEKFKTRAEADGKRVLLLDGSLRLIRDLIDGRWNEADFLRVPPGHKIAGLYDWTHIVQAVPTAP